MVSPTFRNYDRNYTFGPAATGLSLAVEPAGFSNGDGIIAALLIEVGGTSPGTVNTPTDWLYIDRITTPAFTVDFFKILRGSTAPTYTFTWSIGLNGTFKYAELNVIGYSGVVGAAFLENYVLGTPTTGTQVSPPAALVSTSDALSLVFGFSWAGYGGGATLSGYSSRAGGAFYDTVMLDKALSAAGTETPGTMSAADGSENIAGATFIIASQASGSGPTIDTQPQSQTKFINNTATFTVSATTSGGTLHYQWKRNGNNIGTDSNSYTTPTLDYSNNYDNYTVDITDNNGTKVSESALLTIIYNVGVGWLIS